MNRRDFIGRLLASTAGLALAPEALLWRPEPGVLGLPPVVSGAPLTIEQMTRILHQQVLRQIPRSVLLEDQRAIGVELPDLFGVDFPPPVDVGPAGCERELLEPAAAALAGYIKQKRLRRFGVLEVPRSVEQTHVVVGDGLSLRGLMAFDVWEGRMVLRFDVLGVA